MSADITPGIVDFGANQIAGQVYNLVSPGRDSWYIVNLADGREVTGTFPDPPIVGVVYRFIGKWIAHPTHGNQFRAEVVYPGEQNEAGTLAYLQRVAGLTRHRAKATWKVFGAASIDQLRDDPTAAAAAAGFPAVDAVRASEKLKAKGRFNPAAIELCGMFAGKGIPEGAIADCISRWGAKAPLIIRRNPFILLTAGIEGIGFKRADELYLSLGGRPDALKRQTLAAWWHLSTVNTGHTWQHLADVNASIVKAAGGLMAADINRAVRLGVRAGWLATRVVRGECYITTREAAAAEVRTSQHVARIVRHKANWPSVDRLEGLSDHQREKLAGVLSHPLIILGGTPGTGKTYTAAAILKAAAITGGVGSVTVVAPTGKAVVRIGEAMAAAGLHGVKPKTIHSLLQPAGTTRSGGFEFGRDERSPLPGSLYLVDEVSMVDCATMAAFLAAVPTGACVILVGDVNQLPPVGAGAPVRDMIAAGIPAATLTELQRQAAGSAIVRGCVAIKSGRMFTPSARTDPERGENLRLFPRDDAEGQERLLLQSIDAAATKGVDLFADVQILCATNEKGRISRKPLNVLLQDKLNPRQPGETPARFRQRDKIIWLKNEPKAATYCPVSFTKTDEVVYLANGDIGRVAKVTGAKLFCVFGDRHVIVDLGRHGGNRAGSVGGPVDLAYAITGHKSQGSEWAYVVVMVDGAGGVGSREWIYTAISRAKKLCLVIGPASSVSQMIARAELPKRRTFLTSDLVKLLKGEFPNAGNGNGNANRSDRTAGGDGNGDVDTAAAICGVDDDSGTIGTGGRIEVPEPCTAGSWLLV